ncbi:hypothetical protein D3C81_1193470 [compost metagenome]
MPRRQCQPFDIRAGQLRALVRLRQQPGIVIDQHRRLGQQGAVLDHTLPDAGLRRDTCAGEFVRRSSVVMHRQQPGTATSAARVQPYADQAQCVEPDPERAGGKARLVVEQKTLGPLHPLAFCTGGSTRTHALLVTEILVEVDVAQLQLELAVVDETGGAGNRQPAAEQATGGPTEHSTGHDRYSIVVFRMSRRWAPGSVR